MVNEHNDDEIMEKIEDIEQDTLDFDASIQDNSSVFSYIKKANKSKYTRRCTHQRDCRKYS